MLAVDDSVGRIVDTLRSEGLLESTLVVFTSDNGFLFGEHGLIDKRCMYEPSIRVPLIAHCPELVAVGQKRQEVVANFDFAPTFLEAAGAAILAHALAAPMAAIVENAGVEPSPVLAAVSGSKPGIAYDVLAETLTDAWQAGIIDPVKVVQTALQIGVSGALMALTTDVLVHKPRLNRNKEVDFKP